MAHSKEIRQAQVSVLKSLRQDIREMKWEHLEPDGQTILVAKTDVLEIVNDWIEYCLDPEHADADG